MANVISNERLTPPTHFQDVRLLTFDLSGSNIWYATMHVCMYVCMYVCIYMYVCMYICMYVHMYVCMYII